MLNEDFKSEYPRDVRAHLSPGQTKGPKVRRAVSLVLAAVVSVFIAASTSSAADTLKLGYATWVGNGPFFVALEKGFFDEEGVEVELITMDDPKVRMAALQAGRIDAAAAGLDNILFFVKPDLPLQYLLVLDDSKGGDGIIARTEIETIADLKGKQVAYSEGSVSQYLLNVMLRRAGLGIDDIESVNMKVGDAGSAFVAGRLDAAVVWEPWLTRARDTDFGHVLMDTSTAPGLIMDVLVARPDLIESRRDEFAAVVRAWYRAVDHLQSNPQESNEIMARGTGGWLKDPDVFAETLTGVEIFGRDRNLDFFGTSENPGEMKMAVQTAIDTWRSFEKLETQLDPDSLINYTIVHQ